ncbi:unnamed protein product, partial [Meganyctiphanes norvegica]
MVGVYEVGRWGWTGRPQHTNEKDNKRLSIHVISDGITRLPILEGEISHIEIPRFSSTPQNSTGNSPLGVTIVGGSDTPLRCVVVQEVFPDGLVAQDGRLQPGDQIIEVDGVDMTSATHQCVCKALRQSNAVLRLGVYRERIEAYRASSPQTNVNTTNVQGEMISITLSKDCSRHLGLKLGGRRTEPGIFVMDILDGSVAAQDRRLLQHDRILAINGQDVRYARIDHASKLIHQSQHHVSLIVSRSQGVIPFVLHDNNQRLTEETQLTNSSVLNHQRSESFDSLSDHSMVSSMMSSPGASRVPSIGDRTSLSRENDSTGTSSPSYCTSDTDDLDHPSQPHQSQQLHQDTNGSINSQHHHQPTRLPFNPGNVSSTSTPPLDNMALPQSPLQQDCEDLAEVVQGLKRIMHQENKALDQKTVTVKKTKKESLGMRIGGGVNSNEGDTPIYVANINPHGPVGKIKIVKKGDVVLAVNNQSLLGLTHGQAVALLKSTVELGAVTLTLITGPESSNGKSNFIPSWLYWQKLPRSLHISKSVILHRTHGASLGFSIVGGSDPERGPEPIHVLFVVQSSPAAMDGKLRCGDRLLSVDGQSLELVRHSSAVNLLKQAGQRVHLEVVSWLGTEL